MMIRRARICIAVLLVVPLPLLAQQYMALAPDGKTAAYADLDVLWAVKTTGDSKPERIASVLNGFAVPRWSPTGKELAYYSNRSGNLQLWMYDLRTRRSRQLTFVEGGIDPPRAASMHQHAAAPLRYSWSPDGSKIAFSTQVVVDQPNPKVGEIAMQAFPSPDKLAAGEPVMLTNNSPPAWTWHGVVSYAHASSKNYNHGLVFGFAPEASPPEAKTTQLFLLDVRSGKVTQLTHDTAGYFMPEWSPDGKRLAFMSADVNPPNRDMLETNIFTFDFLTGKTRRITRGSMLKVLPRWSPDGNWIAYDGKDNSGTFVRKEEGVYVVPSDSGAAPRSVTGALDRRLLAYDWSPDGSAIVLSYADGLAVPLSRVDVRTGQVSAISPAEAVVAYDFASSRGGMVWQQLTDPNGATTLWFQGRNGKSRALLETKAAADLSRERRYEALHWTNSRGETIDGMLIYPLDYVTSKKYPMVVDAYGMVNIGQRMDHINYVKASANYLVFRPNHRAPHMWMNGMKGALYDAAAVGPNGIKLMAEDILSGVDKLVERGLVDADRMCVVGFSNGGREGQQLLIHTSRFKCAVFQSASTSDWLGDAFREFTAETIRVNHGIAPWEDPSLYTLQIPLFHADKITTPMLLATGDREPSVIATLEMYSVLRYLNREVTLLRYTTEGHGFTGAAEQDFTKRMEAFLAKYLGEQEVAVTHAGDN